MEIVFNIELYFIVILVLYEYYFIVTVYTDSLRSFRCLHINTHGFHALVFVHRLIVKKNVKKSKKNLNIVREMFSLRFIN